MWLGGPRQSILRPGQLIRSWPGGIASFDHLVGAREQRRTLIVTRQRAATRIDAPNPAHDHCGELRRPSTTIGRQAEVIRDASNRHSVRSTGAWDVVYEGRIST